MWKKALVKIITAGECYKQSTKFVFRNYASEVFALGHRINAPEVAEADLVKALTNPSFFTRKDVEGSVQEAAPGGVGVEHNEQLIEQGNNRLSAWLKRYLRFHLSQAPEEMIEAVEEQLLSDELLNQIAGHLGVDHLLRTAEHPPNQKTAADAMRALAGVLSDEKAKAIVIDFIVPQLLDVDFADIYPLSKPLEVLADLLQAEGVKEVEPRLLRSSGVVSAEPLYVVGIYADKERVVGKSAGERLDVAMDMAARDGLLRLWGITSERVFFFGDRALSVALENFSANNYRLSDKCSVGTNLSVQTDAEVSEEPLNVVETALRFRREVEPVVGRSYTKRLRHKFSRGSLAKRSFRYLVKPKPYTVA